MDLIFHPSPASRVLLACTYNAHPVPAVAAIATIERILENNGAVYSYVEYVSALIEVGILAIAKSLALTLTVARQGSAFRIQFMDRAPRDSHDLAQNHNVGRDALVRLSLVRRGIYVFAQSVTQCSISAAYTEADIRCALDILADCFLAC